MNIVFAVIITASTLLLLFTKPDLVLPALTDSSIKAVELSLKMLSIYAVWMGILRLCEVTGFSKTLAKILRPVIRLLYGDISDITTEHLSVNMAANLLGMGNAATPAALDAVKSMDEGKTVANYAMIMLVVINSTNLQILPTSVISLRQSFGSIAASDILLPTLIASVFSTLFGILCVVLLYKKSVKKQAKQKKALGLAIKTTK